MIALLINLFFVAGTLYPVHPMKAFLQMGDKIKASWAREYGEPPYGHAEETKLRVFCQKLGIDLEQAKEILKKNSIVFKEDESLLSISKNNHMSPSDLFSLIKTEKQNGEDENIPSGLGRKTLQELSDMKRIDDVVPDSKIKNIADELGVMPMDVYKLLAE